MRILVSNDDGYFAPGLAALVRAMQGLGQVIVVAPERDRSGASNSLTLDRPLSVRTAGNGFLYLNGTPTDCVHIAVTGLLEQRPDLIVTGINDGANMGDDTIYSGTVSAAMEGYLLGIPAVAFSLVNRGHAHLDAAAQMARTVVERLIREPLDNPVLLNVNIPNMAAGTHRGIVGTRLGKRHAAEPVIPGKNPQGQSISLDRTGRRRQRRRTRYGLSRDSQWLRVGDAAAGRSDRKLAGGGDQSMAHGQ